MQSVLVREDVTVADAMDLEIHHRPGRCRDLLPIPIVLGSSNLAGIFASSSEWSKYESAKETRLIWSHFEDKREGHERLGVRQAEMAPFLPRDATYKREPDMDANQ